MVIAKNTVIVAGGRPLRRISSNKFKNETQYPSRYVSLRSLKLLLLLFIVSYLPNSNAFSSPTRFIISNEAAVSFRSPFALSTVNDRKEKWVDSPNMMIGRFTPQSFAVSVTDKRRKRTSLYNRIDNDDDFPKTLTEIFPTADFLILREDVTLASCYVLCRFLIYDVTTSTKTVPGWQVNDFVMLGGTFSSCIVLAGLWATVGLLIGTFDRIEDSGEDAQGWKIPLTTAVVGPLWLMIEIACGWPPGGMLPVGGLDASFGVGQGIIGSLYTITTGSIGLGTILSMGRYLTK